MTGWPVWSLCQIAAVSARMRCRMRTATPPGVRPRCRSRSSWPLKVSSRDSMTCRSGLNSCDPGRSASRLRAGRSSRNVQYGQLRLSGEQVQQRFALVGLGAGQREGDRQAVQGADQMQSQSPEVAGVAGAVPILGPSGQVGAFDGLAWASALHRCGVHDPHVVAPQRSVARQRAGDVTDELGSLAQSFVVAGLLRQVGEQVPQVDVGVPQPPGLGGEAEHRLPHGQRHQLRVTELRCAAHSRPPGDQLRRVLQQLVGLDVKCGCEGVQVCLHTPTLDSLASCPQGSRWHSTAASSGRRPPAPAPHSRRPASGGRLGTSGLTWAVRPMGPDLPGQGQGVRPAPGTDAPPPAITSARLSSGPATVTERNQQC